MDTITIVLDDEARFMLDELAEAMGFEHDGDYAYVIRAGLNTMYMSMVGETEILMTVENVY